MSWQLKKQLEETLKKERGARVFAQGARDAFVLVYPNSYQVGMSNLGFHIIYNIINERKDTACERAFLPSLKDLAEYRRTNTPLMSIETQRPLYEFDILGFAISYEMDYFNILEMLKLSKISVLANERTDAEPLVIAGGPCATFNPEPLSAFIDVFIIGEGENTVNNLLDAYQLAKRSGLTRDKMLLEMANIPGVYVPRFYEFEYNDDNTVSDVKKLAKVPSVIKRQYVTDLDEKPAHTVVYSPDTEFKNMFLVEVARGCGRHCRFCMAGYCFRKPRIRSVEKIKEAIDIARQYDMRVGLMGAAISDYPFIDEISNYITEQNMKMSVASLRADSLTETLLNSLVKSGQKTLTIAPEAGSERMRNIINKNISREDIDRAVELAVASGIFNIRMYIMIGLPFEDMTDIDAIALLARDIKQKMLAKGKKGLLTLSINPFIPKPFTPFQWVSMASEQEVSSKLKYLQQTLKHDKGIELIAESPREAVIQAVLARGDRRTAILLYNVFANGGVKAWKKTVKELSFDENFYIYRKRHKNEIMPWDHIDVGVSKEYLWTELERAQNEQKTVRCFDGCRRCGVCK